MTTTTLRGAAHPVTAAYTDLVGTFAGAASVDGMLHNNSGIEIEVIKGGSEPAATDAGEIVPKYGATYCNAAAIWVRTASRQTGLVAQATFETL